MKKLYINMIKKKKKKEKLDGTMGYKNNWNEEGFYLDRHYDDDFFVLINELFFVFIGIRQ